MQKYCFSIKTRSGQFIERLLIGGKDREDAERKLNQMYRHCEIVRCEPQARTGAVSKPSTSIADLVSLTSR